MSALTDMVKKAANKISDEVNKNKWDHNSINSALFSSDSDNSRFPSNPTAAKPAFQQGGSVTGTAAPVPAVGGTTPPVANGAAAGQGTINPATTATVQPTVSSQGTQPQPGYTKPVFRSRFAGPVKQNQNVSSNSLATLPTVDPSQKISNIGNEAAAPAAQEIPAAPVQTIPGQPVPVQAQPAPIQAAPVQTQPAAPNPLLTPVQPVIPAEGYCYYVLIKHTRSYPAPNSIVMMRACDHEYVWTDQQSEAAKPAYPVCPGCGKAISHTAIEMDD